MNNKLSDYVEVQENSAEVDIAVKAAKKKAEEFKLDGSTLTVLNAAVDLISRRRNDTLPDPIGNAKTQFHTDLLKACDGNLVKCVQAIMCAPTPDDLTRRDQRGSRVFSFLFDIMKTAMFLTNGRYRSFLAGSDVPTFDARNNSRGAPYGLGFDENAMVDAECLNAIEVLQAWFGVLAETAGFDLNEAPFPVCYERQPDDTYAPVFDVMHAWDVIEKANASRRAKKAENDAKAQLEAIQQAVRLMENYDKK